MPLNSMTGFARCAGASAGHSWNLEIKSVNNKGLDIRTRFPHFLDGFDLTAKKIVSSKLTRGSVFLSLNIENDAGEGAFTINEDRLKCLIDVAARHSGAQGVQAASIDGLLAIKGVVEVSVPDISETQKKEVEKALTASLNEVLDDLCEARRDEGRRMEAVLLKQLDEIIQLTSSVKNIAGDRVASIEKRFLNQLQKLESTSKPIPEERLAQEVAIIAVKADIQEELDRLESHIEEARTLIAEHKPVGRRLDFLCQEFNREANTLCSKSGDANLTKIGLDLKTTIDQFREQIQNIE